MVRSSMWWPGRRSSPTEAARTPLSRAWGAGWLGIGPRGARRRVGPGAGPTLRGAPEETPPRVEHAPRVGAVAPAGAARSRPLGRSFHRPVDTSPWCRRDGTRGGPSPVPVLFGSRASSSGPAVDVPRVRGSRTRRSHAERSRGHRGRGHRGGATSTTVKGHLPRQLIFRTLAAEGASLRSGYDEAMLVRTLRNRGNSGPWCTWVPYSVAHRPARGRRGRPWNRAAPAEVGPQHPPCQSQKTWSTTARARRVTRR